MQRFSRKINKSLLKGAGTLRNKFKNFFIRNFCPDRICFLSNPFASICNATVPATMDTKTECFNYWWYKAKMSAWLMPLLNAHTQYFGKITKGKKNKPTDHFWDWWSLHPLGTVHVEGRRCETLDRGAQLRRVFMKRKPLTPVAATVTACEAPSEKGNKTIADRQFFNQLLVFVNAQNLAALVRSENDRLLCSYETSLSHYTGTVSSAFFRVWTLTKYHSIKMIYHVYAQRGEDQQRIPRCS